MISDTHKNLVILEKTLRCSWSIWFVNCTHSKFIFLAENDYRGNDHSLAPSAQLEIYHTQPQILSLNLADADVFVKFKWSELVNREHERIKDHGHGAITIKMNDHRGFQICVRHWAYVWNYETLFNPRFLPNSSVIVLIWKYVVERPAQPLYIRLRECRICTLYFLNIQQLNLHVRPSITYAGMQTVWSHFLSLYFYSMSCINLCQIWIQH